MNFESLFSGILDQILVTITELLTGLLQGGLADLFGGLLG